ncbi:DUF58 domain-containing protein [Acetobacter lambici]|uniref:DUF58 domain-containing protein n=1 Tax=Acetobacter lambici TaxID=1332824 RepID=A0ABT1EWC9_9PROT|nr:DUF58 domain-containing protein [Acetobacter lambici]MCP1241071.1 DUF58 domain-containing protein [Acetobacter lambici]MCP1257257.1 DUF58 domain-containing protein [Acetobacter lambici]NHO55747.1 DUF58 domain-containing protein [Acetobacter lambici]
MSRSGLTPTTLLRRFLGQNRTVAGGQHGASGTASPPLSATADMACSAQTLATRMPDLLLHASQIATTLASGRHPQRRAGWGDTFWQYRPAQPGEPVNRIDWRQSARTARAHVRETEAEAAQTVLLWCDFSGSMQWRSTNALPGKLDRAVLLLLSMAALLLRNGERVQLLSPSGLVPLPPASSALERLALGLCGLATSTDPAAAPLPPPALVPRRTRLLLASDLLCPDAQLQDCLHQLAAHPARAYVLHVSDPAENTLPYSGRTEFCGLEGEATLELPHVQSLRPDYAALVTARNQWLEQTISRSGHLFTRHQTDMAPLPTLLALHAQMSQRV